MPFVAADDLRQFITRILSAAGASEAEAACVASSLVESNLRGHDSHGVFRAAEYVQQLRNGELRAGAEFVAVVDAPALLVADGRFGFGQVQCRRLVAAVCEKARTQGVACGTLRNCGHVGRLGEWVELAAAQGLAALLSVNDNGVEVSVAPPGGIEPRISTNPLAVAVPTGGEPLVLDISTSAVANGKVKVARLAGRACPPGWIQDAAGNPASDPAVMLTDPPGTLLPLGGDQAYKGFGLGLVLDVLVGGLSGGLCPPAAAGAPLCNNVLLVVWNPELFAGLPHFSGEADKLLTAVRETPRKPGVERIQLPSDRGAELLQQRSTDGIPLDDGNWNTLLALGQSLGVVPGSSPGLNRACDRQCGET